MRPPPASNSRADCRVSVELWRTPRFCPMCSYRVKRPDFVGAVYILPMHVVHAFWLHGTRPRGNARPGAGAHACLAAFFFAVRPHEGTRAMPRSAGWCSFQGGQVSRCARIDFAGQSAPPDSACCLLRAACCVLAKVGFSSPALRRCVPARSVAVFTSVSIFSSSLRSACSDAAV